jgi:hypothetical protein
LNAVGRGEPASLRGAFSRCCRIDLAGLLAALPPDQPLSMEIPHDVRAPAMGYAAWVRAAAQATRQLLGERPVAPDRRLTLHS